MIMMMKMKMIMMMQMMMMMMMKMMTVQVNHLMLKTKLQALDFVLFGSPTASNEFGLFWFPSGCGKLTTLD